MRIYRLLFPVLFVLLARGSLSGTERSAIVRSAKVIVVGRAQGLRSFPWLDGWHVTGSILVETVLAGKVVPGEMLKFEFVCSCCSMWTPPDTSYIRDAGVWFLVPANKGTWRSAGSCSDPGYRPLSRLEEIRGDIRELAPQR